MACDATTLVNDAACFNCQPVAVQMAILLRLACAIRDGETTLACDPTSLVNEANCLLQCIPQGITFAALIPVFCDIATNGGGGGGESCVICAAADPVGAPGTCSCAVAYNSATGAFFYWDSGLAQWVTLIAA